MSQFIKENDNKESRQKYNQEMAIIIPACDKYLDIFAEYMRYFRMNWPDCPFEIILVTETKYYEDKRVTSYTTTKDTAWTGRVLEGLKHTNCKYILTTIEDGFISEKVKNKDIIQILTFMKKHNIQYYRNPKFGHKKTKDNSFSDFRHACKIKKNEVYSRSLGIDIWDREALIDLFGDGSKSAWDIEDYFLRDSLTAEKGYFEDWVSDDRNFLHIIETVSGGKWMRSELNRLKRLGIPVNTGNRAIMPITDYYRRRLHGVVNKIVPKKLRRPIKKFCTKIGFQFASKN